MPSMENVQDALVRCLRQEPPKDYRLSSDASQLATVWAEMRWNGEANRPLEALSAKQATAFARWKR